MVPQARRHVHVGGVTTVKISGPRRLRASASLP